MSKWKPIESAPKNRSRILIYRPKTANKERVEVAYWEENKYAKKPHPYWQSCESSRVGDDRERPPTHWQSLPEPPKNYGTDVNKTHQIIMKCLYCGRDNCFASDSLEAQDIFNVFCSDRNCEDYYAQKL